MRAFSKAGIDAHACVDGSGLNHQESDARRPASSRPQPDRPAPGRRICRGNKPAARLPRHGGRSATPVRSRWRDRPHPARSRGRIRTPPGNPPAPAGPVRWGSARCRRDYAPGPRQPRRNFAMTAGKNGDGKTGRLFEMRIAAGAAVNAPQHQRRLQRHRGEAVHGNPNMGHLLICRRRGGGHHRDTVGKLPIASRKPLISKSISLFRTAPFHLRLRGIMHK